MEKNSEKLFKEDITKDVLDNEIYNQMARNLAKAYDIDIAKTPLVDLITTYIDYNSLKAKNKIIIEENKVLKEKQKEFIKWLENKIIEHDKLICGEEELSECLSITKDAFELALLNYKKIIGVKDE